MNRNENILNCKSVKFYSRKDEDVFFEWIQKIDCIDKTSAYLNMLYLHIASNELHDSDLRDLLALFFRYHIDMKQLKQFLTDDNKKWFFGNPKGYWHKQVFGSKKDDTSRLRKINETKNE